MKSIGSGGPPVDHKRAREEPDRGKLRRADAAISLSALLQHNRQELETPEKLLKRSSSLTSTPLLRSSSERLSFSEEIDPKSDEALAIEGDRLFFAREYGKAKETFLKISRENMRGWIVKRLDAIACLIEAAENPQKVEGKTIREKLANNLRYALKQQSEEPDKAFRLHEGEIPATVVIKDALKREHTCSIQHEGIAFPGMTVGVASTQGLRPSMEDAHLAVEFFVTIGEEVHHASIFAVFDGHGGNRIVEFVKGNLVSDFKDALRRRNPEKLSEEGIYLALRDCIIHLDETCDRLRNEKNELLKEGTTAAVALKFSNSKELWVANTGDSRTIVNDDGIPVQLSHDAKLCEERTKQKVEKLGGKVLRDKKQVLRVKAIHSDGQEIALGVGGSIGDRYNKAMPSQPQVTCYFLEEVRSVLLACDGVWDVTSTCQAIQAVNILSSSGETAEKIAERLVFSALKSGTTDNVTLLFIDLTQKEAAY